MTDFDTKIFRTIILDKVRMGVHEFVPETTLRTMSLDVVHDMVSRGLIVNLEILMASREVSTQVVATQNVSDGAKSHLLMAIRITYNGMVRWLHVCPRFRWLADRLESRIPRFLLGGKTRKIETVLTQFHVCPHLEMPEGGQNFHIRWMHPPYESPEGIEQWRKRETVIGQILTLVKEVMADDRRTPGYVEYALGRIENLGKILEKS